MKTNYPPNRKAGKPKKKKDPWKGVKLVRGRLTGGILTDEMTAVLFPTNHMKLSSSGLQPVRLKSVSGGKTPSRPR